ncbi:hypothetical protein ScPMuIL_016901 [Solemya velum]
MYTGDRLLTPTTLHSARVVEQANRPEVPVEGAVEWFSKVTKLDQNELTTAKPETEVYEGGDQNEDLALIESRDIGIITDVCNSASISEVEIISLIEEQIPKYRLRADTISSFRGYDDESWIQTPIIPLDDDIDLTDEQIAETLKYFIICSERLTQMTKTYNDVEAISRLLEEKERDLELAARIGQTLLERNNDLKQKNNVLEDQLNTTTEIVCQLKHEVAKKDELLTFYKQDLEDETESTDSSQGDGGFNLSHIDFKVLQKKVDCLEDENLKLRLEYTHIETEADNLEEKEQRLVDDCVSQLSETRQQLEQFAEELSREKLQSGKHKEEITGLLTQVVDLHAKIRTLTLENLELQKHLEASQQSQCQLTKELTDVKDKNDELSELLDEASDELRVYRRRGKPQAAKHSFLSASLLHIPSDSLASELGNSMRSDSSDLSEKKIHNWKIFETARAAKRAARRRRTSSMSTSTTSSYLQVPGGNSSMGSGGDSGESNTVSARSSMYLSDTESAVSDGYSGDVDSVHGSTPTLGRPGIPGSNDLETALRRLSLRRANYLNEVDFRREEERRQTEHMRQDTTNSTPLMCRTPDSFFSTGSGLTNFSQFSMPGANYKLPEKLQIVKPLEGSETLRQWQQLATPHLGRLFEHRPGVQNKGERKLDLEEEVYSLSDFEEDDDYSSSECPSKRFEDCPTVNTFTNSLVRYPSQNRKQPGGKVVPALFPKMPSNNLGNGTSTYSMSLGLAAILNERDLVSPVGDKAGLKMNTCASQDRLSESPESHRSKRTESDCVQSTSTSTPVSSPTDSQSKKFLDKIKGTGSSLYGFLSSNTWGLKSQADTSTVSASSAYTMATGANATHVSKAYGDKKSDSTESVKQSDVALSESARGQAIGADSVLGALTSFRRGGIL